MTLERVIAESHSDYSPWASVSAGFLDDKTFVIELLYCGYDPSGCHYGADDPDSDYKLLAMVGFDDAVRMAKGFGIHVTGLPDLVQERFGEECDSSWSTCSHVRDIYDDILNFVVCCGARYRMVKKKHDDL